LRLPAVLSSLAEAELKMPESKYIEKKTGPSHFAKTLKEGVGAAPPAETSGDWFRSAKSELPKFVPFLTKECGLTFFGRILEIGAGSAWFSAELSKLPKVVEVVATDFSAAQLKETAPKVFKLLKAHEAKITRMPADFYRLDFPNSHFDFVVCSALLHHGVNVHQVLCEARRVLKPGGLFVSIREPVKPLVKSRRQKPAGTRTGRPFYSLAEYKGFFARAGLDLTVKRVNLSSGFKYYFNQVVNGLTHARYAFVGKKPGKG
jgi:ubiquinone/menaquinone biosynthesis C-methylase UbiE